MKKILYVFGIIIRPAVIVVFMLLLIPLALCLWVVQKRRKPIETSQRELANFTNGLTEISKALEEAEKVMDKVGRTMEQTTIPQGAEQDFNIPDVDKYECPVCGYSLDAGSLAVLKHNHKCFKCNKVYLTEFTPIT